MFPHIKVIPAMRKPIYSQGQPLRDNYIASISIAKNQTPTITALNLIATMDGIYNSSD